ncbi:MAG: Hsp20/alpha crystallin family protein [Spirochaetales bacterium]|nr:Hsp20/alpha crystallin family protein [Spirochaetales bacterium]
MIAARKQPGLYKFLEDLHRLYTDILEYFHIRPIGADGMPGRHDFPRVVAKKNPNGYTVRCTLPGLSRKDLAVTLAGDVLSIKGVKKERKTVREGSFLESTARYVVFCRSVPLPPSVDVRRSRAELKNGVLTVKLPRREETVAKRLPLQRA